MQAPLSLRKTRSGSVSIGTILIYIVLIAGAIVILTPFAYMLSTSLKNVNDVFEVPIRWIPRHFMWSNFSDGWNQQPFGRYFFNSLFVATCVTILNIFTCSL